MDKTYLNELSLNGQFENIDEFLDTAIPLMKCLKFINHRGGKIYKCSEFYNRRITMNRTWNDLRGAKGDKARRLKSLLLSTTDQPPFWDLQPEWAQDTKADYKYKDCDVSMTSVAEAAEAKGMLLSFQMEKFQDIVLNIAKNGKLKFDIPSVSSINFFIEYLWENDELDIHDYLCNKYEGTKLDFSRLERQYGLHSFEKEEIKDCLQTFDKFVQLEDWNAIFRDQGLRYKKYSPSSKEDDWFSMGEYENKEIDKFRCINPKRCFGYREGDVFYVLRMERNHKISDKG